MKIKFTNTNERELFAKILRDNLKCPYQRHFYSFFGDKSVKDVNCLSKECSKCWEDALEAISEEKEQEKTFTSNETNKDELYDAVCREVTLYEEHNSLKNRAEYLKKDICDSLEHPYNSLLGSIKYHTIQILKEFHAIWETVRWADYADEDHVEYLRDELESLLVDLEKNMYESKNMSDVLQDVAHATEGIYGILVSCALEECKTEHDYYELLVFVQNNWDELAWHDLKNDKSEPMTEPEVEVIRSFDGKYAFLSNAYEKEFVHYGITYQNAEAAYQASKVEHNIIRNLFSKLNAHDAKKLGKQLVIRENWDSKVEMYEVLWDKFSQSPELSAMLMATKDAVLAPEGIGTFWGIENGTGENNLGNILMQVRDNLFALEEEMDVEENSKEEFKKTSVEETKS